jgi:DNA (cytosine-5)-methyltransferase 1
MRSDKLKVLSLYCGCGGLDYGFENHKAYEIVRAYDFDQYAVDTYNLNYPGDKAQKMDVSHLLEDDFDLGFKPDVILGGPPCQDFSSAGKREIGERANQTMVFCDSVRKLKPKFFIMENVTNLKSVGRVIFDEMKMRLRDAGYGLSVMTIRMWEYGVPQTRTRLVILGRLGGADDEFDCPMHEAKRPIGSMREYFERYPHNLDLEGKGYVFFYPIRFDDRHKAVYSLDSLAPTQRTDSHSMPSSYTFIDLDATDQRGLVYETRADSFRLAAILQTFPSHWIWPTTSNVRNCKVIGNAVPPLFSKVLADVLK